MNRMTDTEPMNITQIFSRIYKGAMPRLYENVDKEQYYESYLETYISRDIKVRHIWNRWILPDDKIKKPVEKCTGTIRGPECRLSFIFRQLMVAKKNFQMDGKKNTFCV